MSIKSILVVYSGVSEGSNGLRLAIHMAHKYHAHLTAVVWHGPSSIGGRLPRFVTDDVRQLLRDRETQAVAEVRAGFERAISAEEPRIDASFLVLEGPNQARLAEAARGYDVVVMGPNTVMAGREHFAVRPDVFALRSGRPLILAPHDWTGTAISEHALFAWDGKRAAARALGDAIHILETKSRITVLSVGDEASVPKLAGDDILTLLERHGIHAERLVRPEGRGGVAQTILTACTELRAGLLVMGAYEHSKFSEDILGGVTRDIFDHTELPVFMSH